MACSEGHARAAGVSCAIEDKGWQAKESQAHRTLAFLASSDARLCERGAWCLSALLSLLDLTCSLYHISPRRACSCGVQEEGEEGPEEGGSGSGTASGTACAAALYSIDDMTLSLMKAGFTVSPRGRAAARAGGCVYARQARVHDSALGVWEALT